MSHPFTEADLAEAADRGNYLVRAITPLGGRHRRIAPNAATQLRDRFYALLTQHHAELRKSASSCSAKRSTTTSRPSRAAS